MFKSFLSCLAFLLLIICHKTQDLLIPPVACPNYFHYYFDEFQYVGKISIPAVTQNIELSVHLSQKQPLQTNYYGKIILENRDPLTYRIEFPSATEVPKITKITVNGADVCIQSGYSPPSTRLFLNHKLTTQPLSSSYPRIPTQQYPINVYPTPTQEIADFFHSSNSRVFGPKKESEHVVSGKPHTTQSDQCGVGGAIAPFIFGGTELIHGEFPWLTAIYVKSAGLRFLCGGSLISARTVVSAGHCFKISSVTANRLVVQLGRHNLEDYSEQGFVTREIQTLTVHPEYNANLFPDADLAILHLKQSVKYTTSIKPICLWTEKSDSRLIVGETGIVAGWGADEQGNTFTAMPKKIDTKIVSDSECLRSSSAYNMLTSPRTFCAGNRDDTGPCMGDSGSGLTINRNGQWFLRGIVSAGQTKNRHCNLQEFVVFCDVAKHLQWIRSLMAV